jgi:hypothetical protein
MYGLEAWEIQHLAQCCIVLAPGGKSRRNAGAPACHGRKCSLGRGMRQQADSVQSILGAGSGELGGISRDCGAPSRPEIKAIHGHDLDIVPGFLFADILKCCQPDRLFSEPIPKAPNGLDAFPAMTQLPSQAGDVDIDGAVNNGNFPSQSTVNQLRAREHLPRVIRQKV